MADNSNTYMDDPDLAPKFNNPNADDTKPTFVQKQVPKKSSLLDSLGGVVNKFTNVLPDKNSVTSDHGQEFSQQGVDPEVKKSLLNLSNSVKTNANAAESAIGDSAQALKDIYSDSGKFIQDTGSQALSLGISDLKDSSNDYAASHAFAVEGDNRAKEALDRANKAASIDPDNFFKDLDAPHAIAASIGMLLSGIGSGVTGQPNLAVDIFNKAIDRNVKAKQATYENYLKSAIEARGQKTSIQDDMKIALLAKSGAEIVLNSGGNTVLQGAQARSIGDTANASTSQAIFNTSMAAQKAYLDLANLFKNFSAAQDKLALDSYGILANHMANELDGKDISQRLKLPSSAEYSNRDKSAQIPTPGATSGVDFLRKGLEDAE